MLVLNSPKWLINRYFTLTNENAAFESRDSIKSRDQFFIKLRGDPSMIGSIAKSDKCTI